MRQASLPDGTGRSDFGIISSTHTPKRLPARVACIFSYFFFSFLQSLIVCNHLHLHWLVYVTVYIVVKVTEKIQNIVCGEDYHHLETTIILVLVKAPRQGLPSDEHINFKTPTLREVSLNSYRNTATIGYWGGSY